MINMGSNVLTLLFLPVTSKSTKHYQFRICFRSLAMAWALRAMATLSFAMGSPAPLVIDTDPGSNFGFTIWLFNIAMENHHF